LIKKNNDVAHKISASFFCRLFCTFILGDRSTPVTLLFGDQSALAVVVIILLGVTNKE
jgi:hypothetical protein